MANMEPQGLIQAGTEQLVVVLGKDSEGNPVLSATFPNGTAADANWDQIADVVANFISTKVKAVAVAAGEQVTP